MKIKIFPKDVDEKKVNEWLKTVDLMNNGIQIKVDGSFVIYYDDKVSGLSVEEMIEEVIVVK